jgi:glycosyltransferase involved in cell wall biosynthesis
MLIGMAHPSFMTPGGAEILAARHAEYLRASGHDVRLVTAAFDAARWRHLSAVADIRVVGKRWTDGFGRPGSHPKLHRRVARQGAALDGARVVLAENFPGNIIAANVRGARRTVWYCNEPSRRLYAREGNPTLAARVTEPAGAHDEFLLDAARETFAKHDIALAASKKLKAERALDVASVAQLTRIIANSGFAAQVVQSVYGRAADAVIYPTVPILDSVPSRGSGGLDAAGLRVLVHSRLEKIKNIGMVMRAFHAFTIRHPGAHELHIVGQGPDEANLRALARTLQMESIVRFHGFLDQPTLESVYERCEVMALLPADEPFGMVFPEAAQRGLLLMGPDHGGPFEILDGGTLGWTLDIFSPEPLAEAFAEAWGLSAQEVTRRRERTAAACRDRFGPQATLPALLAELVD